MQKGHENQEQDWVLLSSNGFRNHPGEDWYGCIGIEPNLGVKILLAVIKAFGKDQDLRIFEFTLKYQRARSHARKEHGIWELTTESERTAYKDKQNYCMTDRSN